MSDAQKEAADNLCYFAEIWDQSSLTVWEGVAWAEPRYWSWDGLDANEKQLLGSVGWTKNTWDTPGTAAFEFTSWNMLTWKQREALTEFGFYQNQWNCYMAHYDDYDWFELVMEDVAEHFETLGWTKETWSTNTEPWAWNADWDELDDAEQDAAWEICYVKETWDEIPLPRWSDSVRSGGPSYRRTEDDGARAGLIIVFILLALCGVGGGYFFWKKVKNGKDPTSPKSAGPDLTDDIDTEPTVETPTIT